MLCENSIISKRIFVQSLILPIDAEMKLVKRALGQNHPRIETQWMRHFQR